MATHSDKALTTIKMMNTEASQWGLTPIKWVQEERMVRGLVKCVECKGTTHCLYNADRTPIAIPVVPANAGHFSAEETAYREYMQAARATCGSGYGSCRKCKSPRTRVSSGKQPGMVLRKVMVGYPQWPVGTKFDSRFGSNWNCGLCNKAVFKSNLIPVLAKSETESHGMWVGCDCVKKFLGGVEPIKKLGEDNFIADTLAE